MTPMLAAQIVDWGALLKVVVVSLIAGVGLTAIFSIAVAGAVSFVDFRREGRSLGAALFAAVALVSAAASVAGVAYGIGVMISR